MNDDRINVICVVQSMDPSFGGPPRAVMSLSQALSDQQINTHVLSADKYIPEFTNNFDPKVQFTSCGHIGPNFFRYSPKLKNKLHELASNKNNTVFYRRGLWKYPNFITGPIARRHDIPVMISPVGMLEPWAIQQSRWRKNLNSFLWEKKNLNSPKCVVHALRIGEAQNIRKYGVTNPIAIIPNGIDIPKLEEITMVQPKKIFVKYPFLKNKRTISHIGRIHPVKGLVSAVKAWSNQSYKFPDWHFVIAGPAEKNHDKELQNLIDSLDISHSTSIIGPVFGEEKRELLAITNVFILASVMEAMSLALLEALSWSKPVLISTGCSFEEVETHNAGIITDSDEKNLARGIEYLLGLTDYERHALGVNGRILVEKKYNWDVVAENFIKVFKWMLKHQEKPDFVLH
jgi:glycosyltransferase involved in cell wall biosynthesis